MNFDNLFTLIDGMIGDRSDFKGLTFSLDQGIFNIDLHEPGEGDLPAFICEFIPNDAIEPIYFSAVGEGELKEQINYYVLK
ncbi:hypothetical protein MOC55_11895 [Bacillus spizizenii]|uniref:Uncharacterized protein n=1 Tax=Bacillus spizizenii TaxID=96241 RepID=A0A9Q4DLK2_BACSC|nr:MULTISPECIES: hypothetical protein [Bacillus subtilis group]MCY8119591.1 hypothetical protein [Bacillus spizizenii]MUG00789.1 hypothetical protein [Bacillus tequilensis]MCY8155169.1 hypothetical protein [Bacillus spizizenii]MCY8196562.1 hypothetical protein [Bacillus spizizenii]MCY8219332.1 hypothetical protein [Bacillus spizizenii]